MTTALHGPAGARRLGPFPVRHGSEILLVAALILLGCGVAIAVTYGNSTTAVPIVALGLSALYRACDIRSPVAA